MKELREILAYFTKHTFVKHSFYAFYPHHVWNQQMLWNKYLYGVKPYYAIKSNPEKLLIEMMYPKSVRFDCASLQELKLVKETLPKDINYKDSIIYANPCKSYTDLEYAQKEVNSPTTVVDSFEELDKLVDIKYEGGALVRISVDDKNFVSCFPNPADGAITFSSESNHSSLLAIYNLMGTKVLQLDLQNHSSQKINCSNWPSGIYLWMTDKQQGKFVVMH